MRRGGRGFVTSISLAKALRQMEAKLKQAQETQKQQQARLANAIRTYGRKRASAALRVSDVDVDLQR